MLILDLCRLSWLYTWFPLLPQINCLLIFCCSFQWWETLATARVSSLMAWPRVAFSHANNGSVKIKDRHSQCRALWCRTLNENYLIVIWRSKIQPLQRQTYPMGFDDKKSGYLISLWPEKSFWQWSHSGRWILILNANMWHYFQVKVVKKNNASLRNALHKSNPL